MVPVPERSGRSSLFLFPFLTMRRRFRSSYYFPRLVFFHSHVVLMDG